MNIAKLIFPYLNSKKRYATAKTKTRGREKKTSSVKEKNVTRLPLSKPRSAKRKKSRARSSVVEC